MLICTIQRPWSARIDHSQEAMNGAETCCRAAQETGVQRRVITQSDSAHSPCQKSVSPPNWSSSGLGGRPTTRSERTKMLEQGLPGQFAALASGQRIGEQQRTWQEDGVNVRSEYIQNIFF